MACSTVISLCIVDTFFTATLDPRLREDDELRSFLYVEQFLINPLVGRNKNENTYNNTFNVGNCVNCASVDSR
jgi:hypothetical protein